MDLHHRSHLADFDSVEHIPLQSYSPGDENGLGHHRQRSLSSETGVAIGHDEDPKVALMAKSAHDYDRTNSGAEIVKRIPGHIPFEAWLIVVTEACERFTYYGASLMFQSYLLKKLGVAKAAATALNRGFVFFCYCTTLLGAVIADQYIGKYKTILVFSSLYAVGLLILTLSSTSQAIDMGWGLPGFLLGCYCFIGLGTGGMKSNVSSFVAEQIPTTKLNDRTGDLDDEAKHHNSSRSGDTVHLIPTHQPGVYIDYQLTLGKVIRYFYWAICLGALLGQVSCPQLAQHFGYPVAFLLPTLLFFVAIIVFVSGRRRYYNKPPTEALLLKAFRCVRYALKHRKPNQAHWLDPAREAAQRGMHGALQDPAEPCNWDAQFVEGLHSTFRASGVFCFYPIYWAVYGNMGDNFITQALTMNRPMWFPPDQMNALINLVLIIIIPVFDGYIDPYLNKRGYRLGPIMRITIGFFFTFLAMFYATVLQYIIYTAGPYYDFTGFDVPVDAQNDVSIWWQVIPTVLLGISDFFASATGVEFAYKQAPEEMKSLVMALYLFTSCVGSLFGMPVAYWSTDPYFIHVFGLQSVVMLVTTLVFYQMYRKWDVGA